MDGKLCARCRQHKSFSEFRIRPNRTGKRAGKGARYQGYCKVCSMIWCNIRWNKRKIRAIKYLGDKCIDCEFSGHPAAFDFHHRDPTQKEFCWSKMKVRSWDSIIKELDKCDLLCSCCHRIRHLNPILWPDVT